MKKKIVIIGTGPSALMLAATLNENQFDIEIYEKNFAPGRKFLIAGDGGLNLTHSEAIDLFINRYTPTSLFNICLRSFDNQATQKWFKEIGVETFIGSSKRIFPLKGIKPIAVLNAIVDQLSKKGIKINTLHNWEGWNKEGELVFKNNKGTLTVKADLAIFALGGNSWSKTGSDGNWAPLFSKKGIEIIPFQPSNCAYKILWDEKVITKIEGKSLKNISITCNQKTIQGEVVLTKFGIEGGAVYALSPEIRQQLNEKNKAEISIDLKPTFPEKELVEIFKKQAGKTHSAILKENLNLSEVQFSLLKSIVSKEDFLDRSMLIKKIKYLPLEILDFAPIDEAISTVGGIDLDEIDETFELKKLPGNYVIGEMIDWDAPTGGYLLQANFSMGHYLAEMLNNRK